MQAVEENSLGRNDESTHSPWSLWCAQIKQKKLLYALGFISVALSGFSQIIIPKIFGLGIDYLKYETTPKFLSTFSAQNILLILFLTYLSSEILLFVSRVGWRVFLGRQTHFAANWLRTKILKHARHFSLDDIYRKYSIGELMNASNSDVNAARFIFGFTLIAVSDVLFLGLFCLISIYIIDNVMAFSVLSIFIALPFFISKLSLEEGKNYKYSQKTLGIYNANVSQAVSTIKLQRMTQTEDLWEKKLMHFADNSRHDRKATVLTSLKFIPLMGIGSLLSYLFLFSIGIYQLSIGQYSVGDFVAIQSYILLLQQPLSEIGLMISELQRGKTSLKRLSKIYNNPDTLKNIDKNQEEPLTSFEVHHFPLSRVDRPIINIKNLSFSYPKQNHKILHNLSFKLMKGQKLGVTGPIGVGKSTLAKILCGLEKNFQGDIFIFDHPLRQCSKSFLNQSISIVPQNPFLFAESIRNNLVLNKSFSDDELWKILEATGLSEEVHNLAHKLDSQLGEKGVNLSGGQKQRLTIARALILKPKILILDDCFSAIDTITEKKIVRTINELLSNSTVIWMAHRESTLQYCDDILEL